jgi:NitT/TauT family transport system ATP-binding protein
MRPSAGPALSVVPDPSRDIPKVSLRAVRKTFAGRSGARVAAVEDISFDVARGEFVCLVGPSGSGKTTLVNLIAGLERPDEGEILIDGRPVTGPGPDRAVLFQEPALFPWLSVAGNVEFALKLIGVPRAQRRERAASWLEKVHLGRFMKAHPHELSGGMRQRAALARALACEPEVLLADEPFGALDAQTREVLQDEVQRVWLEDHRTFVFVTHNVREAVFLADRVLLLSAPPGTLVEEQRITAPRPREQEDVLVSKVVSDVHERLRREVRTVVEREVGDGSGLA